MYSTETQSLITDFLQETGLKIEDLPIGEPIDISQYKFQFMHDDGEWNDVIYVIRKPDSIKYNVIVGDTILEVSAEHKLKVHTGEFIEVQNIDTNLYKINYKNTWEYCIIEKTDDIIPIVDFMLSGNHTYLTNDILSHNTTFGDPYTTSGGKAIGFHASCRLRLKSIGQIKAKLNGIEQIVGIKTKVQVVKNRMGPPLRSIDFDIYFDSGIDDYGSWLSTLKQYSLVKQGGSWYTYVDKTTGEELKFQAKDFAEILDTRPEIKEVMYNDICDAYILSYKEAGENANIDNTEIDENAE